MQDVPQWDVDATPLQISFAKYMERGWRGVNVFQLSDGTFVQDTPTAENQNSNVPWPMLPPGQPLTEVWTVHQGQAVVTRTYQNPSIVRVFYGGHKTLVDDGTAGALFDAGYSGNLTPA